MKIGIITYWSSQDNYGQLLQCFALQEYLRKRGHNPYLIRYEEITSDKSGFKLKKLFIYLRKFPKYWKWYWEQKKSLNCDDKAQQISNVKKRDFIGFLSRHIVLSPLYNSLTIYSNPPEADLYICGSDQIWGGDETYYLSFVPDSKLKIAYAPSLGGLTSFPPEKEARMRELIGRLDKIGMREQSGVETCRRLGRKDAIKVVDPTLLLDAEDYSIIASQNHRKENFVLIYLLGNPIDIDVKKIFNYVKRIGYQPIYVASQGRRDNFSKEYPTIEEWINLISKAKLVITNSFHCTVFALQFHRPFIAIPLSGNYRRMNTRIEELLKECCLLSRFTSKLDTISEMMEEDFNQFESYKHKQQLISKKFLDL